MEDTNPRTDATLETTAKAIADLDDLIKAVQTSLPGSKPWQRQLHQYLQDIERHLQILRMTLAMDRIAAEVAESAHQLRTVLRVTQRYLASGRADLGTKAAVGFACELGQQIATSLDPERHREAGLNAKRANGGQGADQSGE